MITRLEGKGWLKRVNKKEKRQQLKESHEKWVENFVEGKHTDS